MVTSRNIYKYVYIHELVTCVFLFSICWEGLKEIALLWQRAYLLPRFLFLYHLLKFFKRWEYQTTLSASWEICMQVKKQQLERDMEQQTGSKSGKEYVKAVYCHSAYLTYMQSTSCKMLGWIKHKLESRLLGEISITSDMQVAPPLWQKAKKN